MIVSLIKKRLTEKDEMSDSKQSDITVKNRLNLNDLLRRKKAEEATEKKNNIVIITIITILAAIVLGFFLYI